MMRFNHVSAPPKSSTGKRSDLYILRVDITLKYILVKLPQHFDGVQKIEALNRLLLLLLVNKWLPPKDVYDMCD